MSRLIMEDSELLEQPWAMSGGTGADMSRKIQPAPCPTAGSLSKAGQGQLLSSSLTLPGLFCL